MQTITYLQGPGLWPFPNAVRDALLKAYNTSLTPWPHNLTFNGATVRRPLVAHDPAYTLRMLHAYVQAVTEGRRFTVLACWLGCLR